MTTQTALAAERDARLKAERALAAAQEELSKLRKATAASASQEGSDICPKDAGRARNWIDTLRDGLAVFDSDRRLVFANAAYLTVLGPDVRIGSSYDEILQTLAHSGGVDLQGQSAVEWIADMDHRFSCDRIPNITVRFTSGHYIKVIDRRTADGDVVSLSVDVTRLMQMWAGVEAIPDGFVIYDRDDRMVQCNQRYRDIYSLTPEVTRPGTPFQDILSFGLQTGKYLEAVGREEEWKAQRLSEHRAATSIVEQPLDNGRWLRILEKETPDGGRVGLRVDITQQKRQQQQLEEARRAAEAANRAKSAFLANMSHELRTPMNGVVGMADILCETRLTDEQRLYAETIRNSGESLLALINDVLDFSKIEADKLTLHPEPFNLEHTIHEVIMLMRGNALGKGLELYIDYDMFHPTIFEGDRGRIRQILTNLIGNAVKFTEVGHILVRVVGVETETPGVQQIHMTVEDTGIGISEEMQSHIFGEFNQVEDEETRRFQGTGLGLSISKRLIELMGGELWVESTKGKGSCFGVCVTLPLAEVEEEPLARTELTGARVLVVDDQKVNRTILERQLTPSGAKVTCCDNGEEARRLLRNGAQFDLVLTDYLMPGLDGVELAKHIRAAHPNLPLVLLTSDPTVLGRQDARDSFDSILQKPSLRLPLIDTLRSLLNPEDGTAPVMDPAICSPDGPFLRILAAEDNQTNRLVFRKLLDGINIDLVFAENGQEAVEAFRNHSPDLIFMDVSMPEMDGPTATRIIREMEQSENRRPIPIIALTAHALPGDEAKFMAAGMDAYLTKPLRRTEILKAIETHAPTKTASLDKAS